MTNIWIVDSEEVGARLNTFLKKKMKGAYTAKEIAWAVEHNGCQLNGKLERFLSRRLSYKDRVEIRLEKRSSVAFEKARVLFDDEYFTAYDKPAGISTEDLSEVVGHSAIHRLDRDTSGVILFAKREEVREAFVELFRKKKIRKHYLALVLGVPLTKHGMIENKLGCVKRRQGEVTWDVVTRKNGLPSKTEWFLEKAGKDCCLLKCIPHTGRTHQIRVHLKSIGHPILGDAQYGTRRQVHGLKAARPFLHAERVEFKHPFTNKFLVIESEIPEDFQNMERLCLV